MLQDDPYSFVVKKRPASEYPLKKHRAFGSFADPVEVVSVPISTTRLPRSRRADQVPRTAHPGSETQCQSGFLWARLGMTTLHGIEREYARDG